MSSFVVVFLLSALGSTFVHLFSGEMLFLEGTPRSVWLSVFGGVCVAYVFVHLLPELAEGQEVLAAALDQSFLALVEKSCITPRPPQYLYLLNGFLADR